MSLSNTRLAPVQSGQEDEDTRIETVEEVKSISSDTRPQSEGATMIAEDDKTVKHDHCYSLSGELHKAASEDLWCYETLDEFIAETLEVKLQKNPDPSIKNILGKGCENQEVFGVSGDSNCSAVQRGIISEEYEETGKIFNDLVQPSPPPVYYEDQKAFKRGMLKIKPSPKVKRRRRSFK